uniref:Uncharacterized protein n=1 Tax=Moniliophthora roreri TaxID=221103 RepID=A0A0W0FCY3_MONRR
MPITSSQSCTLGTLVIVLLAYVINYGTYKVCS